MSDFIIKEEFFEAEAATSDRFRPCPKPAPCPVLTGPDLSGGAGPVVLPTAAPSINFSGAVTLLSEADAPSFSSLGLELPGLAGHLAGRSAGYSAGHSLSRQPDVTIADANLPTTMLDGNGRSAGHLFTDSTMISSDDDLIMEGDSPSVDRTLRRTLSGHSLKKPPDLGVVEELVLPNSELVLPNSMSPLAVCLHLYCHTTSQMMMK